MKRRSNLKERFLKNFEKADNGCWNYMGHITAKGYGRICRGKELGGTAAHRYSWELHHGEPPPKDMFVCHKCDNRRCVNPDHLFLGTNQHNVDDCVSKDRHPRGSRHGQSKLTEDRVKEILSSNRSGAALAREFGVHPVTVQEIRRGLAWKHVHKTFDEWKRGKSKEGTE